VNECKPLLAGEDSVLASPLRVIILSTVLTSVIAIAVAWQFRELPPDKDMTAAAAPVNINSIDSNAGDSSAVEGEKDAGGVAGASSLTRALLAGDAYRAARHIKVGRCRFTL
jgi:hypothetical protein